MKANKRKICMGCGRMYTTNTKNPVFCSNACKMRYANHRGFDCTTCRTADCRYRNRYYQAKPNDCPNYKWDDHKKL